VKSRKENQETLDKDKQIRENKRILQTKSRLDITEILSIKNTHPNPIY